MNRTSAEQARGESYGTAWTIVAGEGPVIATAIHDGHALREEVKAALALDERERRREEDEHTGYWASRFSTHAVVHRSRFEFDVNRPRDAAVYLAPEHAWGLSLWRSPPVPELIARSLQSYDAFYREMYAVLRAIEKKYGRFLVLDLHTYNHRRQGQAGPPAAAASNPDVNVGTGTMVRERWAPVVDGFIERMRALEVDGRRLDVRENVRFLGGYFPSWIHRQFPTSGCALAIEVKKFFMDEWSGAADFALIDSIGQALSSVAAFLSEALYRAQRDVAWTSPN
jgi:N-formylglutamate amidohydrolase